MNEIYILQRQENLHLKEKVQSIQSEVLFIKEKNFELQ